MGSSKTKFIVLDTLIILPRKDGKMFAARLKQLKLTSYGKTPVEAEQALKGQFYRFVSAYRKLGLLEKRMTQVGIKWYWEDEYVGSLPVEDTTPDNSGGHKGGSDGRRYQVDEVDMAMAA